MSYKIITHNGKAHMDELLGIALLAYHKGELPTEIERIHPDEAAEIIKVGNVDNSTYFVDCGLQFTPEKHIFDHHHVKELGCAALLIFEHYFSSLLDTKLHDYVKLVSLVDTKGPNALGDFNFKSDSVDYFSFSQKIMLKEFEQNPIIVTRIFFDGLVSIIEFEKEKEAALQWIKKDGHMIIEKIGSINLLKFNYPPPIEIASGVKSVNGEIIEENDIHAIYSYDKEDNSVRTLFRTVTGHEKVDFTKADVSDTQFCHKGGFLLKFRPKDDNEWMEIVNNSIV